MRQMMGGMGKMQKCSAVLENEREKAYGSSDENDEKGYKETV